VREILVAGGVPPADVASVGKSFSEPRMLGDSDEARRQNRRVELKFTSQKNLSTIRKKVRDLMLDESP
jgi:outer membrane protein OmpA-like peptidoglycan-associated protein